MWNYRFEKIGSVILYFITPDYEKQTKLIQAIKLFYSSEEK